MVLHDEGCAPLTTFFIFHIRMRSESHALIMYSTTTMLPEKRTTNREIIFLPIFIIYNYDKRSTRA